MARDRVLSTSQQRSRCQSELFLADEPASVFHRNQFGVAGSGALLKNNLFIFGDYQGVRQLLRFAGEFIATKPAPHSWNSPIFRIDSSS